MVGIWDIHIMVVGIGDLLLLDASRLIAETVYTKQKREGESKGEYLAYSARLQPRLLSIYALVSKWMKRLYSGLYDRSTRVRGNMLGLMKTSIF